jgi:hypothetical protein
MDAGDITYDVLDGLRACLCTEIEDSRAGATCFCGVYPGQQTSADWCTCTKTIRGTPGGCGMAWVRLVSVYPYDQFPTQAQRPTCATPLAAVIELGVFRCIPGLGPKGEAPDAAAQADAVLTQTSDLAAMLKAMTCCEALTERTYVLGRYTPASGGNCGGGSFQVTVALQPLP